MVLCHSVFSFLRSQRAKTKNDKIFSTALPKASKGYWARPRQSSSSEALSGMLDACERCEMLTGLIEMGYTYHRYIRAGFKGAQHWSSLLRLPAFDLLTVHVL